MMADFTDLFNNRVNIKGLKNRRYLIKITVHHTLRKYALS